ncbi:MAG: MBL fold metallo-hydrolase [Myxococcota bacterium]|nr:MBL fold metallo-hydrolase [Myxococcota bacterium]
MRIRVVGSSDAFNSGGRANSCFWLEQQDAATIMVDLGPTGPGSLKRLGLDPQQIDSFVFTHLHGDHIAGFPFWLLDGLFQNPRERSVKVIGPLGIERRLKQLTEILYGDILDRDGAFEIDFEELLPNQSVSYGGWKIAGFPASHMDPPEQPLCLQIHSKCGIKVGFSGDTEFCDGLMQAGHETDLFIAECSALKPPAGRHCTWEEWKMYFGSLTTKKLLLTHLNDGVRSLEAGELPLHDFPILFADDGMTISF